VLAEPGFREKDRSWALGLLGVVASLAKRITGGIIPHRVHKQQVTCREANGIDLGLVVTARNWIRCNSVEGLE
jgi:hypothetical protein